ncbi:MAG: SDR family oxidoreductase [Ilumatobacter sp.]|nr:SDR family oxidoreductase [Ilumatobacter sp.]
MTRWNRALVTGASSGIGRAIATQLAADGTRLVVVARDEARLNDLADEVGVDVEVLVADLADPRALARVEDRLRDDEAGPIDLLVNNAGFGVSGPFHEVDVEVASTVIDVNVTAVHRLAQVAATAMVNRSESGTGGGGILNVSSMVAFAPSPNGATYAATKAFVNALSEALHAELQPHRIHVTALCPGFTRTEFQDRADYDASGVPDRLWQNASEVAAAGLEGVDVNRAVVVPGAVNRIGAGLVNALPGSVRRFVVPRISL